ncbi:MAG: CPBP family intramembrane metalloprotease [Roseburia sp.]|nr:CPBP family intramembrane metalloprotease [Roseburia sp.]MCM1279948.1 CPBP family intramembrane metalloprotease [Robinsoniella sp.]
MSTDKEPEIGTQENTNSKKAGKSSYGYIFILYVQSFLIVFGGQILGMVVMALLSAAGMFATAILSEFLHVSFSPIDESPVWITGMEYAVFVGIWIVALIYIGVSGKNRPLLKTLWTAPRGNRISRFLLGCIIGFGLNGLCILIAYQHQDISFTFEGFHPLSLLFIFICVFIQSSAEEFVCRGILYQKLLQSYQKPAVAIIGSSLFFAVLHLGNEGVTILSLINIMLTGLLFAMMVYYLDSLWCAFAAHTVWNFTQNIVFGLPNSGITVPYSIWKLDTAAARNSFAYQVEFGIEATVFSNIVLLIACIILFLLGRRFGKSPYDVSGNIVSAKSGQ